MLYVPTNGGKLHGIDRTTGEIRWTEELVGPTWSSPVVVDNVLLQGDCAGVLRAYDVTDPSATPPELWTVELDGCLESSPAVWNGTIYAGTSGGRFHALTDL